jgi:hypothetical protein
LGHRRSAYARREAASRVWNAIGLVRDRGPSLVSGRRIFVLASESDTEAEALAAAYHRNRELRSSRLRPTRPARVGTPSSGMETNEPSLGHLVSVARGLRSNYLLIHGVRNKADHAIDVQEIRSIIED